MSILEKDIRTENPRTNAYRSSKSVIVSGPGTMYNEITRPKTMTKQYGANTNTYDVTRQYIKSAITSNSKPAKTRKSTANTRKSTTKSRKNKRK